MSEPFIAVVDFGGQYAHLIARRVRALGMMSRIVQPTELRVENGLAGIILSGGPRSVLEPDAPRLPFDPRTSPVPILGLCYGHQLLAQMLGGRVCRGGRREYGLTDVVVNGEARLFAGIDPRQTVWMSHGDHVSELPHGLHATASSANLKVAAFECGNGRFFGMQFHPEVTHTRCGNAMLDRFLECCTSVRTWQPRGIAGLLVERVRAEVGERRVLLLVSGGVDSLVALAICSRALRPEQIHAVHVDTGLMRLDESREVMRWLQSLGLSHAELVEDDFSRFLAGVVEPEEKRARIGRRFVEIVQERLGDLHLDENWLLAQGTIYPDTIESGATQHAAKIKTHHNRVKEIEDLLRAGRVVEPLRELYKDEVREVGRALGLPDELVNRHPFPGPGLGIRVVCSDGTAEPVPMDDVLFQKILGKHGLCGKVLPIRSVGVQGDERTYRHPAVVWFEPGRNERWSDLLPAAVAMVNQVSAVNRVVFALAEPGNLEVRPTYAERGVLDRLRAVDAFFRRETLICKSIWQMPVVALPLYDARGGQAYVLRAVTSEDAMTAGVFEFEFEFLRAMVNKARAQFGIGPVFVDITTKPPATIEWE